MDLRRTHKLKVIAGVESFAKRTGIRNLEETAHFSKDEVSDIYDKFFGALYYTEKKGDKSDTTMDEPTFRRFLASITNWVDKGFRPGANNSSDVIAMEQSFVHRLYVHFDRSKEGVSLQDAVLGLSDIYHGVSCHLMKPVIVVSMSNISVCSGHNEHNRLIFQPIRF